MAEQPALKLMYFNFPGKAGAIRMALHYCGLAFEDYRFKDDRSDFAEMKTDGTSPFGQCPMLQVDGAKPALAQSVAILRYVAKLAPATGLYPEEPLLAHAVDALCDQEKDFWTGAAVSKYTARFGFGALDNEANAPLLAEIRQAVNDEVKPRHLANVEAMMKAGGTQWIAGTAKPSIADFVWIRAIEDESEARGADAFAASYPALASLIETFAALGLNDKR